MKEKGNGTNSGIQVFGGTLKANNLSVGDGASVTAKDSYEIGQALAVGPQADTSIHTGRGLPMNGDFLDLGKLLEELSTLLDAMKNNAKNEAQREAVNQITAAKDAAREGKTNELFGYLKAAGSWALQMSEKIGTEIACPFRL